MEGEGSKGRPVQSETILPAVSRAADVQPEAQGVWPVLCDIHDHVSVAGSLNAVHQLGCLHDMQVLVGLLSC